MSPIAELLREQLLEFTEGEPGQALALACQQWAEMREERFRLVSVGFERRAPPKVQRVKAPPVPL